MRRLGFLIVVLAAGFLAARAPAPAHTSGCHSAHTCPSDHHTYAWIDRGGVGWDCAKPGAPEYDPNLDTTPITYDGLSYECRAAGTTKPVTTTPAPVPANSSAACGVERWAVKTLTDPAAAMVDFSPRASSVSALRRRSRPAHLGPRVLGLETRTYRLTVRLVSAKSEQDSDVHLVVADPRYPSRTMIVELPSPSCTGKASTGARRKMSAARRAFTKACGGVSQSSFTALHGTATVTGVLYFDYRHGQRGVAPNAVELHPLTGFSSTNCQSG